MEQAASEVAATDERSDSQFGAKAGSSPTSRIAVQKVYSLIVGLSEYKRFLIEEIGFGGVLHFPDISKLNLKFSSWIMAKVDVRSHTIDLGPSYEPLKFYAQDFHKIFGIPDGSRNIYGPDAQISVEAVQFIRDCIGLSDKFSHSLKAAESFVRKPLSELSSTLEKDCFKMSFVIFIMGNLLSPSTKHDYTNVDYWGAIRETENIGRFNWCHYCLDQLLDAVTKLKTDVATGVVQANNLSGCHLFLQVFFLDNVDLGVFNLSHNVIPRVQHFNGVRLKQMILMCSHKISAANVYIAPPVRSASVVCYTRHNFVTDELPPPRPNIKDSSSGSKATQQDTRAAACYTQPSGHGPGGVDFFRFLHQEYPLFAGTPLGCALKQHNAKCLLMANQMKTMFVQENMRFANKICEIAGLGTSSNTPLDAGSTIPLQRHITPSPSNMRASPILGRQLDWSPSEDGMHAARREENQRMSENRASADHIPYKKSTKKQKLSEDAHKWNIRAQTDSEQLDSSLQYSQYRAASMKHSTPMENEVNLGLAHRGVGQFPPTRAPTTLQGGSQFPTVSADATQPSQAHWSKNETPVTPFQGVDPPPFDLEIDDFEEVNSPPKIAQCRPPLCPRTVTKTYSDNLVAQLLMVNDEIPDGEDITKFGQTCSTVPAKEGNSVLAHCPSPIMKTPAGRTHAKGVDLAIADWIDRTPAENLSRIWIDHKEPRYIAIPGYCVKAQLHGPSSLDHELGSIVVRRLAQLDEYAHRDTPGRRQRLLLEPDFATAALAGEDVRAHASVRNQFVGEHIKFNIADCRYVFATAIMPHGWCTFTWDMHERELLVLDPLACIPDDGFTSKCLDYAADTLHDALFNCLNTFFTNWHCARKAWSRRVILLTTSRFSSNETGMCMVHIIRHFNGTSLTTPLTKEAMMNQSKFMLVEVLHIEGNSADLQLDALECVANAAQPAEHDGEETETV